MLIALLLPWSVQAAREEAGISPDRQSYSVVQETDPLEPLNRKIFAFNEIVDGVLLEPLAIIYTNIFPEMARDRVGNAIDNLSEPVVFVNAVLQRDPERAFGSFWRFMLNSTLGIGGLFDFAGANAGLPYRDEDFGQTLGVYGWGSGPYLVLPVLGPSSGRDALGKVVDAFADPFNYIDDDGFQITRYSVTAVHERSRHLELMDEIYRTSFDPYVKIRSMYLQARKGAVDNIHSRKGATPGYE